MSILVTGGAGFIGSHLVEALLEKNQRVIVIDNFNDFYDPSIKRHNIQQSQNNPGFELYEGSITDPLFVEMVLAKESIKQVIHLAARAGVRPSIENPLLYVQENVYGTNILLEACRKAAVEKFIFGSSSSVYGINSKVPFSEEDPINQPISPYASTKRAGELLCYTYHHLYKLPVTCLRFFTVYGPRQRPDMAIHKFTKLIDEGKEIVMFGDGSTRRDYTFITDIVNGIIAALEHCSSFNIYNLGESKTIELKKLITLIENSLGKKANIRILPNQPGDVPITYANIDKARREIGYEPSTDIEQGTAIFADWFKAYSMQKEVVS